MGIEKTYNYHDESGNLLYQVVRFEGKEFRQRRPDGSGWAWGLGGCRRVLYNLPMLRASNKTRIVFIPEGEKDVDTLVERGFLATCNPMGAGKWQPEYDEELRGCHVVILPDNDPIDEKTGVSVGEEHGRDILKSLYGKAASIKVLRLPGLPPKGDVSDWFAAGHSVDEFRDLVKSTPTVYPVASRAMEPPKQEAAPPVAEVEPVDSANSCGSENDKAQEVADCGFGITDPRHQYADMVAILADLIIETGKLLEAKKNLPIDRLDRRRLARGIIHELRGRLDAIG